VSDTLREKKISNQNFFDEKMLKGRPGEGKMTQIQAPNSHNGTEHNDTEHNDTEQKATQHNST
jgi:hypothetical protein